MANDRPCVQARDRRRLPLCTLKRVTDKKWRPNINAAGDGGAGFVCRDRSSLGLVAVELVRRFNGGLRWCRSTTRTTRSCVVANIGRRGGGWSATDCITSGCYLVCWPCRRPRCCMLPECWASATSTWRSRGSRRLHSRSQWSCSSSGRGSKGTPTRSPSGMVSRQPRCTSVGLLPKPQMPSPAL